MAANTQWRIRTIFTTKETNVAKNCLSSSLIGPKGNSRRILLNKRNIGLSRLTPIFSSGMKPQKRKGAAPATECCCLVAEPERKRDRPVGFDEQRWEISERTLQ
jgi:hypothetical protein